MASSGKNRALNVTRGTLLLIVYIILFTLSVVAVVQISRTAYQLAYQVFGDVVVSEPPGEDRLFRIEKGESNWEVAEHLKNERLVVNQYTFYLRLRLMTNTSRRIEPGEYLLNTSMTYEDILGRIIKSEVKE